MVVILGWVQLAIILLAAVLFFRARIVREASDFLGAPNPAQKAYIMKGEVSLGDLVALLPYWTKKNLVELRPENGGLLLIKKNTLPANTSPEQSALFQSVFAEGGTRFLGVPKGDFLKQIGLAKTALSANSETTGSRIYTGASSGGKKWVRFLLFVSMQLYGLSLFREISLYSEPMEPVVFIIGVFGIIFAVWYTVTRTSFVLARRRHLTTAKKILTAVALVVQYLMAAGIVLFASRYLPEYLMLSLFSFAAYVLLPLFCVFIDKRTDAAAVLCGQDKIEDILYAETRELYPDVSSCDAVYRLLETLRVVWDDAETLKITGNAIPVRYR